MHTQRLPFRYHAQRAPVPDLTSALRERMSALYLSCYDGTSEALFQRDLAEKDEAILLWAGSELAGFTTLKTFDWTWRDQALRIVYSGDTLVTPAHWGQPTLALAWIECVALWQRDPLAPPLYWFLLVKGHRTYKYLSVFAQAFHPHWSDGSAQHDDWRALANALAEHRFGAQYDPAAGVVRFATPQGHLTPALAEATPAERGKEATRYFLARNPGYRRGDELVCLCPLSVDNMKPFAARVARRVLATGRTSHLS
ncbi:MAG: hypothetical protein Q4G70_10130 [Pseudomonadota bacterium]|nr:hypothetical protein [Pseudomonadota bacterium]